MLDNELRKRAISLRKEGATFQQIVSELGVQIPKSTLSFWLKGMKMPKAAEVTRRIRQMEHLTRARAAAVAVKKERRELHSLQVMRKYAHIAGKMADKDTAMIALAVLYLGEGSKKNTGSLTFCNANPKVITLYLQLLAQCFALDGKKFRCTVQGRADQDFTVLEKFWSRLTGIPLEQFYSAQADKRTVGKPTLTAGYRGVCRIDYFSTEVFTCVAKAIEVLTGP